MTVRRTMFYFDSFIFVFSLKYIFVWFWLQTWNSGCWEMWFLCRVCLCICILIWFVFVFHLDSYLIIWMACPIFCLNGDFRFSANSVRHQNVPLSSSISPAWPWFSKSLSSRCWYPLSSSSSTHSQTGWCPISKLSQWVVHIPTIFYPMKKKPSL